MDTHMKGQDRSCPPVEGEGIKLEMAKEGATKEGVVSIKWRVCKIVNRCAFRQYRLESDTMKTLKWRRAADLPVILPASSWIYLYLQVDERNE